MPQGRRWMRSTMHINLQGKYRRQFCLAQAFIMKVGYGALNSRYTASLRRNFVTKKGSLILKDISYEMLTEADHLKKQMDGALIAVIISDNAIHQKALRQLNSFSLDSIHHYKHGGNICLMDIYGLIVKPNVDVGNPFMVLVGATIAGRIRQRYRFQIGDHSPFQ